VEIRNYLRDQAGSRSLVFDLIIAHDRFGSTSHVMMIIIIITWLVDPNLSWAMLTIRTGACRTLRTGMHQWVLLHSVKDRCLSATIR